MRGLFVFAMYLAPAIFLVWRAETYVDVHGHGLLLARCMSILLALMISMVGVMRGLETYDSDTSSD